MRKRYLKNNSNSTKKNYIFQLICNNPVSFGNTVIVSNDQLERKKINYNKTIEHSILVKLVRYTLWTEAEIIKSIKPQYFSKFPKLTLNATTFFTNTVRQNSWYKPSPAGPARPELGFLHPKTSLDHNLTVYLFLNALYYVQFELNSNF